MAMVAGPSLVLALLLGNSRASPAAPPPHWTVIANADWPHNGGGPPAPAVVCDSAECCADHCLKNAGCAAVSWNWKKQDGTVGDHGCNFKCTDAGQNTTPGEQGVVVRKGKNFCRNNPPGPPPPSPPPPPVQVPKDWVVPMQQGSLFFYSYDIGHTDINTVYGNGAPLGNGFVGTKADAPSVFIGGVYSTMYEVGVEPPPQTWVGDPLWRANESARARIPATVSSIGLPLNASGFAFAGAALDAKRAVYIARHTTCGGNTVIERRTFAHRVHRGLLVTEIVISGKCGVALAIPLRSFADNGDMNYTADIDFTRRPAGSATDVVAELGVVKRPEHCNVCPNGVQGVCGKPMQVAVVRSEIPRLISVPPNTAEMSHLFIASYATDLESEGATPPDPLGAAEAAYTTALADGAVDLMSSHVNAWADLWDQSAIEVEGDELLARAAWSAAYPIVSSIRLDWGEHHGLAPGGLFSGASPAAPDGFGGGRINYLGHVFWDCEMWSWPALLPLHPDLAAAALKYRKRTIDSARTKAAYYGWGGTMFAWESAAAGGDMCPCGGKGITREHPPRSENSMEIHINSDISFATALVYKATGNKTWLAEVGAPLAHGVAEFWASRVTPCSADVYGVDKSRYCVRGVMGPDESHAPVDDSPFTSAGAQFSLKWGIESAKIIGCQSGACAAGANWSNASDIRVIYDAKLQYHPQNQDCFGFINGYCRRSKCESGCGACSQHKGPTMTPAATVNDIVLYEKHMSGPAMTWAIFAINLMALAEQTSNRSHFLHGEEEFKKSYQYLGGISGGSWHEGSCSQVPGAPCGSGTGNFITGSGGFLQSVVSGYGGLRYNSNTVYGSQLELTPQLPSGGATRLFFKGLHYLGSTLSLDIAKTGGKVTATLTLRNMTAGAPSISLVDATGSSGGGTRLQIGSPVEVPMARKIVIRRTEEPVGPQPLRLSAHRDGQSRPDARSNALRYTADEHANASLGETAVAPAWHEGMELCSGKCEVNCKTYRPPVGACYSPPLLWPGDTQWGRFDTLDRCNATHLDRSFFSSLNGSCTNRTDGFSLPLHTCIGPFGKPRPWGKFSCSPTS